MSVLDVYVILFFWVPVALICYNWVLFPAILALVAAVRSPYRHPQSSSELPTVSVIIAAFNEELNIREKLENTLAVDYPRDRLEVLVGSDASDDGTDDIVRSFSSEDVKLLRLEKRSGKPAVLNMLMAAATGEVVVSTDADVGISPDFLRQTVRWFADPRVGVVHPHYRRTKGDGSPGEGFFDRYEAALKRLQGRIGAMVGAYGWALVLRRELCDPIPTESINDDFIMGFRPFVRGFKVVYDETALAWTQVETEVGEFKRKARIARGNLQALGWYWRLLWPGYGPVSWIWFSHKVLRMVVPALMVSIFVLSLCRMHERFFLVAAVVQVVSYAIVPLALLARGGFRRLLLPQYYILMNIALVVGYWQHWFGARRRYWERTERD